MLVAFRMTRGMDGRIDGYVRVGLTKLMNHDHEPEDANALFSSRPQ